MIQVKSYCIPFRIFSISIIVFTGQALKVKIRFMGEQGEAGDCNPLLSLPLFPNHPVYSVGHGLLTELSCLPTCLYRAMVHVQPVKHNRFGVWLPMARGGCWTMTEPSRHQPHTRAGTPKTKVLVDVTKPLLYQIKSPAVTGVNRCSSRYNDRHRFTSLWRDVSDTQSI